MQVHATGAATGENTMNEVRQEGTQEEGQAEEVNDDDAYRNVFLVDYRGNVVSGMPTTPGWICFLVVIFAVPTGFWQYGFTTWFHFLEVVHTVIVTDNHE